MGGPGSGRRYYYIAKHQVEWCLILDAGILAGHRVLAGSEDNFYMHVPDFRGWVDAHCFVRDPGTGLKLDLWFEALPRWKLEPGTWLEREFDLTSVIYPSGGRRTYLVCPGTAGRTCGHS